MDPFNISVWCASDKPNFNLTQYTSRLCHRHNVEEDKNSLGLRHTRRRYRRSVPNVPDQPDASDYQSHGPWYRRRPRVDQVVSSSPTSGHILTRAVVPTVGYQVRPAHINPAHPRKVSPMRPKRQQLSLSNPRKLRTPTARYRRSVASETGQATYANHQTDPKTKVSPERPLIDLSPSWSVRRLAAPRSVGPVTGLGCPTNPQQRTDPPGVCGSWPLLAVWDPRFSRAHRQPTSTFGPSWSVRHLAASRSMGPAVFLGSPLTHSTSLVPPGVCGTWPLLAVWDPRFSWVHRQPTTPIYLFLTHHERPSCTVSSAKVATQPSLSPRLTRDKQHHTNKPRTSTASSSSHAGKPLRGFSLPLAHWCGTARRRLNQLACPTP